MKTHSIIALLLITSSIPTLSNTIEFSAVSPVFTCEQLQGEIKPVAEKFEGARLTATFIGYDWNGTKVAGTLIINPDNMMNIKISERPRLHQTPRGCLFRFTADSPPGYTFYEPDHESIAHPSGQAISAKLSKSR